MLMKQNSFMTHLAAWTQQTKVPYLNRTIGQQIFYEAIPRSAKRTLKP